MPRPVRVVDLFCGGGGLSLGVAEAARRVGRGTTVALAVEVDQATADVYSLNFPEAALRRSDISVLFDGDVGAPLTKSERALAKDVGRVDILVAGPPCQGHSDLNNHTRRQDPRNALYLRAVRAVEILQPRFVLIENVPAVRHDKGRVIETALAALRARGYTPTDRVLDLARFGVPQRRHRHVLLAVRGHDFEPSKILEEAVPACSMHDGRSVRWAIEDLLSMSVDSGPDSPSKPTPENLKRMRWLHAKPGRTELPNSMRPACHRDKEHSYVSMYGRLSWDDPAQTITTGFGSMGQGRFVHPALPRTITPHEAARLQTLPDFYNLDETKGRGAWAKVIGNAVPPLLAVHLVEALLSAPLQTHVHRAPEQAVRARVAVRHNNQPPPASNESIRARMRKTKRRDTKPELALRSALHRMGLRFQVDRAIDGIRSKADIVFPTERVAIYVDGCFWHSCPDHGTAPKSNGQWWAEKLANNKTRDLATTEALTSNGWLVLRFWEHLDALAAATIIHEHLTTIRARQGRTPRATVRQQERDPSAT